MSIGPPLPYLTELSGGGFLGSKTLDFLEGGGGGCFSLNLRMGVASALGCSILGSSSANPLVGSTTWLGVGTTGCGMGMPALLMGFTFTRDSAPPPMPPQGLPPRWIQTLGATAATRPMCSQAEWPRERWEGASELL